MESSRSLVTQSSVFQMPVAQMRRVFQPDEVERKLAKLQDNEVGCISDLGQQVAQVFGRLGGLRGRMG